MIGKRRLDLLEDRQGLDVVLLGFFRLAKLLVNNPQIVEVIAFGLPVFDLAADLQGLPVMLNRFFYLA